MATLQNWWRPIPDPGDPPDISAWLFERIKVNERGNLVRAQLAFQKKVLAAQLELLTEIENIASQYMG